MSQNSAPSQTYLRNAVLTATPEQLQLMLFDGAIKFATRGLEALQAKDREATFLALERAQLIVLELANGIRREVNPELADRMTAIYNFVFRRLVDANVHQDEKALHDALRTLRYERETWVLLIEKLRKELHASAPTAPVASPATPAQEPGSFSAEG
ncbi:MAG TPA: flagellar export chaperone FliS [Phycisphaerae bacterium]|nr:flagellar export chaperone FliS [Phycisphaerae bacterium]HPM23703.1 flagellar export chaperone FliS [Phycisphaerae bacterium]HQL53747.1 flagellar export chaperone FliS [Phycisphaerae bacterium]